jgi:anti-sigma28 factor (negative regulator of flagellin synthesis)
MPDEPLPDLGLRSLSRKLLEQQEGSAERKARLEQLRQQFKAGEYVVDSEALAQKLLDEAADEIVPERRDHLPESDEAK